MPPVDLKRYPRLNKRLIITTGCAGGYDYVRRFDAYRGDNFSEKLENYVLDTEERRDQLVLDWNRLQAEIQDKRWDLDTLRSRIRKLSEVDRRFAALTSALLELVNS